jgi:6-phosphogluconolactonase
MTSIIRPSTSLCQQCRWHPYSSTASLEQAAAHIIHEASKSALRDRNAFHIVLAGGNTPRHVYELLQSIETDWHKWHIYFGDERCLPQDHPERNSQMAAQAWLQHVDIPTSQIHLIPAELGLKIASTAYANILQGVALFDLVILGLGEDGHTASLFPLHDWGTQADAPATLAIHDAPKPPPQRISLSAHRLSQTRQLIFLVSGAAKHQAVIDWRNGKDIPAASISPNCGVDIYIEKNLLSDTLAVVKE